MFYKIYFVLFLKFKIMPENLFSTTITGFTEYMKIVYSVSDAEYFLPTFRCCLESRILSSLRVLISKE
jgi:hypothetical protein